MKKNNLIGILAFISVLSYTDTIYRPISGNINGPNNYGNQNNNFIIGVDTKSDGTRIELSNTFESGVSNSILIGAKNTIRTNGTKESVAIGYKNIIEESNSVVVGAWNHVKGHNSTAMGIESNSLGKYSVAVGRKAGSKGENSIAMGNYVTAIAKASSVFGIISEAKGEESLAVGYKVNAGGKKSTAIGNNNTISNGEKSVAIGSYARTYGENAVAIGHDVKAEKENAIAIGNGARADFQNSIVIGNNAHAERWDSIVIGDSARTKTRGTIAIGQKAYANEIESIALGNESKTNFVGDVAFGFKAHSTSKTGNRGASSINAATAIGSLSKASNNKTVAVGVSSNAEGDGSTSIGADSKATIDKSVALGLESITTKAVATSNSKMSGITFGEFAGKNPISVVSIGSVGKERQLQNVAAGQISKTSTDAINGSQLFATNSVLTELANSTKTIFGGNATITTSGKLTMSNIGNTGKNNIHEAIIASKTEVTANNEEEANKTKGNIVLTSKDDKDGHRKYNVKLNDKITLGSKNLILDGTNGTITGLTNKSWNPGSITSGRAATEDQLKVLDDKFKSLNNFEFNVKAGQTGTGTTTGTVKEEKIVKDDTLKLNAGDNLSINQNGKDFSYSLNKELKGLKNAEFEGTNGNKTKITGDEVSVNSGKDKVSLSKDGLDNGGKVIKNVAEGKADTDGVNKSQLDKAKKELEDKLNKVSKESQTNISSSDNNLVITSKKGANGEKEYDVKLNDKVTLGKDGNKVELDGTKGEIKAGQVTVDGKNGVVNGLTNKKWDSNNIKSGQAATENQLKELDNNLNKAINDFGFNVTSGQTGTGTASGTTTEKVKKDSTVKFNAGDNLDIKQSGKDFTYSLSKDLKGMNSVKFGENGKEKISLSKDGLDNGGKVIKNVGDGKADTDGVNLKQLKDSRTEVKAENGSSVDVKSSYDSAKNKYTYTLDVKADNKTIIKDTDGKLKANVGKISTEVNNDKMEAKTSDGEQIAKTGDVVDAINRLGNNTMSFGGDNGNTDAQSLNKNGGLKFNIRGSDYITTTARGNDVNVDLSDKAKNDIAKGVAANSGVANAIAMANLPQISSLDGYRHNIAGSYGYYNGENAFALGLSGINNKGNIVYKASGSLNTKGHVALGAGIGYQFGSYNNSNNDIKETDTIINSSLEKLNALNHRLNEQNHKLNDQNNKLNEQNKDLNNKIEKLEERLKNIEKIKSNEDDLYTINGYNLGISELTSSQIDILKNIVEELNANYKNRKIYITGYTDNVSNENLNLELGLKRANKVAQKLRELGLDMSISIRKVSSSGYNNIVETNNNSNGRSSNRRVEIELR
ncbi:OmpA family protein [Streptobacillus ratti]|uniref:OmpA family protein n=1 Tax=Streptobacillus ratti TaxID=1720557 RepID=UPI00093243E1|nr:OmpA family protein [Streptobacillus ratti]